MSQLDSQAQVLLFACAATNKCGVSLNAANAHTMMQTRCYQGKTGPLRMCGFPQGTQFLGQLLHQSHWESCSLSLTNGHKVPKSQEGRSIELVTLALPAPGNRPYHHRQTPAALPPLLPTTASSFSYAPEPLPAPQLAASCLTPSFAHSPPTTQIHTSISEELLEENRLHPKNMKQKSLMQRQ